ncbi:MAG: hypothetical protein V4655_05730 [Bdellovibrionota bacterium]|nr:MAG: hypothetical protein EOP10_19960 [Pseudomonadota bacterium]
MKDLNKFGLVMGANFETVAAVVVAYYAAEYLNEKYPKDFNWSSVTYVLALLLIFRSWYVMLRVLVRDQKANEASAKVSEPKDDKRS